MAAEDSVASAEVVLRNVFRKFANLKVLRPFLPSDLATVRAALESGASPSGRLQVSRRPYICVAAGLSHADLLELLLKYGADPSDSSDVEHLRFITY